MEPEKIQTSLPENAYRELKPGEEYTPVMPASSNPKEVTPYSVTMGVVMAVVFSAAAAFLGLKVGQVFEAAIPIAIIAVGMGSVLGKKNMLGQNVIIQSIGASSGVIVAGAIFTLPALYILGLDAAFWQVFLSSLFGGLLGIGFGCLLAKLLEALLGGMLVASMGASGITFNATPTMGAIMLSFGVSVGIGILFGYLPANKAAKLNPIDALRYD